ncbi:MAG: hypothetical protein ACSLFA_20875 [Mycobacterium sp.]
MSDAAGEMLDAARPVVDVLTEYMRACRRLGHPTPDPAQLMAAYTAEEGLDLQALDDDGRALTAAVAAAEEAMLLQEHARRTLVGAWQGAGAEAAVDHLLRHADAAGVTVDGLRSAAGALAELRNRLWQLIDAKVGTAIDVEARGMRAEWLSAARIVNTGAGDRSGASELVDLQVAPFVADDIAVDWASSLQRTESAVRQAYGAAAAAMSAGATAVFDSPGALGPSVSSAPVPVAAEQVNAPGTAMAPVPAAATAPAGYSVASTAWPDPAPPAPAPAPVAPAAAPPPVILPSAAPAAAAPVPDPMAAAPMPPLGGLGGGTSPLGSGLSGLSGAGQPVADLLGGLLGSGGDALRGLGDLEPVPDEELRDAEFGDPADEEGLDTEDNDNEDNDETDGEDNDETDDETADEDDALDEGAVVPEDPAAEDPGTEEPVVPAETFATEGDPPVPTPVPEPLADPGVPPPAAPADTPCEIAADELPQAGP